MLSGPTLRCQSQGIVEESVVRKYPGELRKPCCSPVTLKVLSQMSNTADTKTYKLPHRYIQMWIHYDVGLAMYSPFLCNKGQNDGAP